MTKEEREQKAREFLEWERGTRPGQTYVTSIATDELVRLLADTERAVWEAVATHADSRHAEDSVAPVGSMSELNHLEGEQSERKYFSGWCRQQAKEIKP